MDPTEAPEAPPEVRTVPIGDVHPATNNPRSDLGDLTELVASITAQGIVQMIGVREMEDGRLVITHGHRRRAAAELAGLAELSVTVETMTDEAHEAVMLVENLHREDLTALDKAAGYKALADRGNTQAQIAALVGVSQANVSKHLALLKLPKDAQKRVADGTITQAQAVILADLPKDAQKRVADSGYDSWRIEREQRDLAERRKASEELAKLKAAGVPVVELEALEAIGYPTGKPNLPAGPVRTGSLYWLKGGAHKKAECRAVAVDNHGLLIEVCTKPSNHPQPRSKPSPIGGHQVTAADRAEVAKHQEELDRLNSLLAEANERRMTFLRELRPKTGPAIAAILQLLLGIDYVDMRLDAIVDMASGIKVDLSKATGYDDRRDITRRALIDSVATDAERLGLLVLTLSDGYEAHFEAESWGEFEVEAAQTDEAQGYLGVLISLGYEPSWIERRRVGLDYEEPPTITAVPDADDAESTDDDDAESTDDDAPVIPHVEVKLTGKRWIRTCTVCGKLEGFNTTKPPADERAAEHLDEFHGISRAVAS